MLKTVMGLQGNSFDERWSKLEKCVREHCAAEEAPYPQRMLERAKPWFESIGDWFGWAAVEMGEVTLKPSEEDSVLKVLAEAEHLMTAYGGKDPDEHVGLPGEIDSHISTIYAANGRLLYCIRVHPEGSGHQTLAHHPLFRDQAVLALAEYLYLSGHVIHPKRWPRVERAVQERADRRDETFDSVLVDSIKRAVLMAIDNIEDTDEIESHATTTASAERIGRRLVAGQVLMKNLIPGTDASELRKHVNENLTQDFLGSDWRSEERQDELKAEVRESARMQLSQAVTREQEVLLQLYAEELLSLDELTDRERQICRLRYEQDLYPTEIGDQIDITPSTVRSHLKSARDKFQKVTS